MGSIWVIWLPELTDLREQALRQPPNEPRTSSGTCHVFEPMSFAELRQKSSAKSSMKSRVGQRFFGQRTWVCYGCNKVSNGSSGCFGWAIRAS